MSLICARVRANKSHQLFSQRVRLQLRPRKQRSSTLCCTTKPKALQSTEMPASWKMIAGFRVQLGVLLKAFCTFRTQIFKQHGNSTDLLHKVWIVLGSFVKLHLLSEQFYRLSLVCSRTPSPPLLNLCHLFRTALFPVLSFLSTVSTQHCSDRGKKLSRADDSARCFLPVLG